jgi:2-methylcitrate dehydratase PrpD
MVTPANETLSLRLAQWLAALHWPSLPARQRELAALRVLDTVGLLLAGAHTEATSIARAYAERQASGRATMVGTERAAAAGWAAFVNGVAGHCWDFDDTFPDSVVHPGSIVVPTALAVGEEVGANGAEILTAIAGGYEIAARLGSAAERRLHNRGFHASGIFAPIVAAFVTGRLRRLPPEAIASAVGLAASMSGGLLAFLQDGSWSKWLHFGWGNMGGILAADLAAASYRGPLGALDGRHNLYATFLGETAAAGLFEDLGMGWRNENALFKLYPCAHVIHAYIDLALAHRRALSLDPRNITRVIATVAPWAVPIVCEPVADKTHPATTMQAIASLQFNVAAAFADGVVGLDTIEAASRARTQVCALADRVEFRIADLPGFAAELAVETADGERHVRNGAAAEATPERLKAKFALLAARALPSAAIEAAMQAILDLAEAPNASAATRALKFAADPQPASCA